MEKKPLILIVDDNEDTRMLLSMILSKSGFVCETGSHGKEALQIMESGKIPDLILSDIMMPEMDGYTFFDHVQQNPRWHHIPFIFLSSKDSISSRLLSPGVKRANSQDSMVSMNALRSACGILRSSIIESMFFVVSPEGLTLSLSAT